MIDPRPQSLGEVISPREAMTLAIREGHKGTGFVSPNPLVGCVIVDRDHKLLAVGHHAKLGGDHAEIAALKNMPEGHTLEGCHVYVTLEPCAHQGRTGSCARALAPLKPASVTYAVEDPNPLVAGKGAAILREAGVRTDLLSERTDIDGDVRRKLAADAEDLAEIFLHGFRANEPFVAAKVASSLDGKMAFVSGESKWITGEIAREHVQLIRARYDAVAVGRNTFVADDPQLNVRHEAFPGFANKAIVFDPQGKTLASMAKSKLASVRAPESVFVVTDAKRTVENPSGARVLRVPMHEGAGFMMDELMIELKAAGISSVLVEGGSHTYGEFFNAFKVQRLHAYIAPILLGGKFGVPWSSAFGGASMKERIELERIERLTFGADEYWSARVRFPKI